MRVSKHRGTLNGLCGIARINCDFVLSAAITGENSSYSNQDGPQYQIPDKAVHTHTHTLHTVISTHMGGHQERPSTPLIRYVKPSKYAALTNTLELEIRIMHRHSAAGKQCFNAGSDTHHKTIGCKHFQMRGAVTMNELPLIVECHAMGDSVGSTPMQQ